MGAARLVVTAPGRANLCGNPSDQYGGRQVSCSVPLRARVEMEPASTCRVSAGGLEATLRADDLAPRGDDLDLARAVLRWVGAPLPDARLRFGSEIPRQSGLAGSTALVVALLAAVRRWRGEAPSRHALAEEARRLERRGLGVVCGFGDQYMAVFGGLRFLDFRDKAHGAPGEEQLYATTEELVVPGPGLPFVLATTGVRHDSSAVHAPIRERWLAGEPAAVEGYARVAELGALAKRALIDGDLPALAGAMNENHAIQRDLGGSGPSNERLVAAALAAGAPAAKLAGAGQGGTVVVLWPEPDAAPLEAALRGAGAVALHRPEPCPGLEVHVEA